MIAADQHGSAEQADCPRVAFTCLERKDDTGNQQQERNRRFNRLTPFVERRLFDFRSFRIDPDMVECPRALQVRDGNVTVNSQLRSSEIQFNLFDIRQAAYILLEFRRAIRAGQIFKTVCFNQFLHLLSRVHAQWLQADGRACPTASNRFACLFVRILQVCAHEDTADDGRQ